MISTLSPVDPHQMSIIWNDEISSIKKSIQLKEKKQSHFQKLKGYLESKISEPLDLNTEAILTLLDQNISNWKKERAVDIASWPNILSDNFQHVNIISRVLFECIEPTEQNKYIIRQHTPTDISLHSKFFTEYNSHIKKYPNLQELFLTSEYLDFIIEDPKYMIKLISYHQDFSVNKMNIFKHHVFTNQRFFDKLTNSNEMLHSHVENYIQSTNNQTNLYSILKNFDSLFKTRPEQLTSLTGLILLLEHYAVLQIKLLPIYLTELNTLFNQKYPDEFKLFKTCKILDITDFKTILNTVQYNNKIDMNPLTELPALCL